MLLVKHTTKKKTNLPSLTAVTPIPGISDAATPLGDSLTRWLWLVEVVSWFGVQTMLPSTGHVGCWWRSHGSMHDAWNFKNKNKIKCQSYFIKMWKDVRFFLNGSLKYCPPKIQQLDQAWQVLTVPLSVCVTPHNNYKLDEKYSFLNLNVVRPAVTMFLWPLSLYISGN